MSRYLILSSEFPASSIVSASWRVVDNAYSFLGCASLVAAARRRAEQLPHFLWVGRKASARVKNLDGFLAAYCHYQRQGGGWGLRLIGGELDRGPRP